MIERTVDHLLRSTGFGQKLFACFYRLWTQVSSPIEDLVDVEVDLQLSTEERPEATQDRLP